MNDNNEDLLKELNQCFSVSPYNSANGSRYIACVGENGDYGLDTILDGFAETVILLVQSIGDYKGDSDPLVYPILYSVRHSIELFLKISYERIFVIKGIKANWTKFKELTDCCFQIKALNNKKRHPMSTYSDEEMIQVEEQNKDIEKQIEDLKKQCNICWDKILSDKKKQLTHNLNSIHQNILEIYNVDDRIKYYFDFISKYLSDYLNRDPDGDMYRYLVDDHNKRHFVINEIGTVDLLRVGEQFLYLKKMFEFFLETLSKIYDEYCTLTYTSKLSRQQLRDISNKVPKPLEFNEKIKTFKSKIMDEYDISSSDFDKALKIIKEHPEFSWNMGKELLICKISDNSLLLLKECSRGEKDWMLEYKNIPEDEFYALLSYKELGCYFSEYNFSEKFNSIFDNFKNRKLDFHGLTPTTDLKYIINGMKMCGQNTYATFLNSK